jgi:dolichol-phosphate mannosyltransferase
MTEPRPLLSVVVPVFNEEEVLPVLFERLSDALRRIPGAPSYEIVFVNDGSADGSGRLLREFCVREPAAVLITLSRNFGQQASITAGLERAAGECVIILDADLQDPPELIPALIQRWRDGCQIVLAQRRSRGENLRRRLVFSAFYRVLGVVSDYPLQLRSGVFGLMDRKVVDQLLTMPEQNRFLPGMRSWLGFRQGVVEYDRSDRAAGEPKQTLRRLLRYGRDAIFSFSYVPLRLIWMVGSVISLLSIGYAAVLLVMRVLEINVVRGFTTPTVSILFLGGVQLIAIGVLGEYLARIYDEVRRRPLFVVDEVFRQPPAASSDAPHDAARHVGAPRPRAT